MHSHEYGLRGSPISAPDRTPLSRWSRSGSHPDLTDRLVAVKAARGRPSPVTRECSAPHGSPHLRGVPWDVERLATDRRSRPSYRCGPARHVPIAVDRAPRREPFMVRGRLETSATTRCEAMGRYVRIVLQCSRTV